LAVLLVLVGPLGCSTLETPGTYQGDAALYDADVTITTAFALVDTTLKWEKDNRAVLSHISEIKQTCDAIRVKAPPAFKSAIAARDEYEAAKTDASKTKLEIALAVIRRIATEAATLMQENIQ
jgi:hypothetical protein